MQCIELICLAMLRIRGGHGLLKQEMFGADPVGQEVRVMAF